MTRRAVAPAVLLSLVCCVAGARAQHAGDMLIGSTATGGGTLALDFDFTRRIRVFESASGGGNTLYSSTDPGWDLVAAAGALFPLTSGTPVSVQLTAVDPGVSLKIGATTLTAPGQTRLLGTAPDIHVHPSWQMVLPAGVPGERTVSFRMTTTSGAYAQSVAYTAILTNTTTSTSTSSSTTTTTSSTTTTLPAAGADLLAGTTLVLKDKPGDPSKRSASLLAKDPNVTLGAGNDSADDPTLVGGSVRIASETGGFDLTYPLPAPRWKLVGKPGEQKGYAYRDGKRLAGPIASVTVKAGKSLKVVGKGDGLGHGLAVDPMPVDIVLSLGGHRQCLRFGGTVTRKTGATLVLRATAAPAPAACAP